MRELGPNRDREAFVGRAHEFAELVAGIDGALASQGRLLMISGEPGAERRAGALGSLLGARGRAALLAMGAVLAASDR
jgi:hypothetical protein